MKQLLLVLLFCSLNNKLFSQTPPKADVYTPKGSAVDAYLPSEMSVADRAFYDNYYSSPNRVLMQYLSNGAYSSSMRFNCHGYAWNMVEGGPIRWIGYFSDTEEDIYMIDGSYIQVCNEIFPGKVSWVGGDHSAVTTSIPGRLISKWNMFPLMEHDKDDTPYGNNYAYYASTKIDGDISNLYSGIRTFSVQDIPNATYTWSTSSNLSFTGSGNQITVQKGTCGDGAAWAEVAISTLCSSSPVTTRVSFYVSSTPKPGVITAVHDYPPGRIAAEIDEVPGATSYKWYLDGVLKFNSTATSVVFNQRFNDCGTGYYIAVEAVNSCGTSPQTFVYVAAPDCGGSYIVSPNPSSSTLVVSYQEKYLNESSPDGQKREFEVKLYDNKNRLLRSGDNKDKSNKITFETAAIPNGNYFLHILDGKNLIKKQVIINHE